MIGNTSSGKIAFRILFPLALLIDGARSYVLQEIPQVAEAFLSERSTFLGGWAVYTPNACPDQTAVCPFKQFCCPSSTVCTIDSLGGSALCCPDKNSCATYVESVPVCANTSWSMYQYFETVSFCCQPGQVGLTTGVCVDKGVAVAATQLASTVAQITGTVAPSAAATVRSGSSAGAGAQATRTASQGSSTPDSTQASSGSAGTGTSSGSSSSSSSTALSSGVIGGIAGGVVGGLIIIALLVSLAFHCGRRRGANEHIPRDQYGAPGLAPNSQMTQNTQMGPPTPSLQSAYPQKYDGYSTQVTSVPAHANVAEFGDGRPQAYSRAELGPAA